MTKRRLHEILALHKIWVETNGAEGKRARLHGVNLARKKLQGLDLRGINFSNSRFSSADLTGADLTGAKLTNTNFQRADLTGVNLTGPELLDVSKSGIEYSARRFENATIPSYFLLWISPRSDVPMKIV